ncbi:MAG TPA: nuclear transport factor 2 family protein [Longimicrobium sp.]|jgi:hypothetical protein
MDDELRRLVDEREVVRTIDRLFVGTDRRDWEAVRACFAPRVLFDMTSVAGGEPAERSPEEIAAGWEEGLRPLHAVHHQAGNHEVAVRGDEADAFCYGVAFHYLPNASGRNTRTFVGSYDFHLVRADGRWAIDRFRFDLKFIDGNPSLEAEAGR